MQAADIKKKVKQFRHEYGMKETVTCGQLESILDKQGFTIVEFYHLENDPDVETLIKSLGLTETIKNRDGFLYMDEHFRIIFVNEQLSEAEKRIVLAHEEAHYYCGHCSVSRVVGRGVEEEFEANEFVHFLLTPGISWRIRSFAARHRKKLIAAGIITALICGGGYALHEYRERQLYEGEYYVTMHGEKYHREDCVTIAGHEIRRLTKEDVKTGAYEPCEVCRPDRD